MTTSAGSVTRSCGSIQCVRMFVLACVCVLLSISVRKSCSWLAWVFPGKVTPQVLQCRTSGSLYVSLWGYVLLGVLENHYQIKSPTEIIRV